MNPFQALIRRLLGERGLRARPRTAGFRDGPSPRSQAYAELRAAESRGDTRSIGTARMKLAQATHDQLSAEVWGQ
jgi:hypothetical protein